MTVLQGKSVCSDIADGRLAFYRRKERRIRHFIAEDKEAQWQSYLQAKQEAARQLEDLCEATGRMIGSEEAAVFEVQKMLLDDCEYVEAVHRMIFEQSVNVEYAVWETGESMAYRLQSLEDDYIRERAQDITDITRRLLNVLYRDEEQEGFPGEPAIVAADDLTPSETVQLSHDKVLGFVLRNGSVNSHTAILAKTMGVPALFHVGGALSEEYDGAFAILDGDTGVLYIDPDGKTIGEMTEKKEQTDKQQKQLLLLKGMENRTRDGRHMQLNANAGNLEDIDKALMNDAGGIGLLRSEILYLGRDSAPDEETQFAFYREALRKMSDKEVVIRTLDIGADKQVPYLQLKAEENPAMGLRAVRICLKRPELFKTQLRALYRAGQYGRLRILYPMITSAEEIVQLRRIEKQVKEELTAEGVSFAHDIPTGIMIETPGAALISDELAGMVDFFSVGTNDLTQYTLALDRQNPEVESFGDARHKAVLRLIRMAAENAKAAGIPIGICGDLAGDVSLTETFIEMGIGSLSVPPAMILPLRRHIREL